MRPMSASPRFELEPILAALAAHDEVEVVGRGPQLIEWDARDFADELAALRASDELDRAVLAALGPRPELWLGLPQHVALQWEAELAAFHEGPVGCLGGLCMRSLLDAWALRDDRDWRPPAVPEGCEQAVLLDIDDYHGNGDFTIAVVEDGRLRLHYCDGHVFFPLHVEPLRLFRVGLQALGWPHWQLLFCGRHEDPRYHARCYLDPMCAALARWLPGEPRPELLAAIADWRALNPL